MTPDLRGRLGGVSVAQLAAAAIVGAAALVLALFALTPVHVRLSGTNSVRPDSFIATLEPGQRLCQTNVLVPAQTGGVRVLVGTFGRPGPPLTATLRVGEGTVRRGSIAGYANGARAIIRWPAIPETAAGGRLCLGVRGGKVALAGQPDVNADNASTLTLDRRPANGDLSLQFVRPGKESLLALAPTVFRRASLFRPGWVGQWTYYALITLALALVGAAVGATFVLGAGSSVLRRGPLLIAGLAFMNAVIWSLATPPFQAPDESAHYAYVESLAEHGRLPSTVAEGTRGSYTPEETLAVDTTAVGVVQNLFGRPPWTRLEEKKWAEEQHGLDGEARSDGGGYTTVASYLPFYYAAQALPYKAGLGESIFTRLWLMRLLSALFVAGAAACTFLFAREMVPSVPWVAPVAGLVAAFEPMFAFLGGAVNNDTLFLFFACAELYALALALRRGLSVRLALTIGALLALGFFAKPSMVAFVPLALIVVAWVMLRDRIGLRQAIALASAVAVPLVLMAVVQYGFFSGREAIGGAVSPPGTGKPFRLNDFASYLWQWYLPRLPFMQSRFSGSLPLYQVYFKGFWADFGHLDTSFPEAVYKGLVVACLTGVGLITLVLWRARDRFLALLPRLLLCLLAVAGVALLVNLRSYISLIHENQPFAQGRYLLPVIPVFALAAAVAALAFGRRNGLVAATVIVAAIGALNLFSLGLVMTRFYT